MFIQVIRGSVNDPAAAKAAVQRWQAELRPGAPGYLGMTSGVADDGTFIAVVRFASAEAARESSERPEQDAWWRETSKLFDGEPRSYDCPTVDVLLGGPSDDAGFVQLEIFTGVHDVEAIRAIDKEFARLAHLRPDLIGVTTAFTTDGQVFATNYFTSEAEAREAEKQDWPAEVLALVERLTQLTDGVEYVDLRTPWLHS
jgi:hypothetical protein